MKFSINSKALLNRLTAAGKAVSNRPTIYILSNMLFALDGNVLTITASDSENCVTSRIEVNDTYGSGKFCIDAKRIIELFKAMPDCEVSFDVDDNTLGVVIRYTNGKYRLSGHSGAEYPMTDTDDTIPKGSLTLTATEILNALDKVDFAVRTDELRPMLKGIYWDIKEDAITFVATDTRVLAKYRSTKTVPGVNMSFTLPDNALSLVRAFISRQAEIRLTVTEKSAIFEGDDFKVRTTLFKGKYPDYNRVIPGDLPISVTFDRIDFSNAIARVSICADAMFSLVRLRLTEGTLEVVAQDTDFNIGGEERMPCDHSGKELEIGFGSSYLKGVLNAVSTQKIFMKMYTPDRPCLFLPAENDEYGELTLLCMPMTIKTA